MSTADVSPQVSTEPAGRRPRAHIITVSALTALVAAVYAGFALARYYTFRTSSYDLVIFDQAVRSYAHFRPGISIVKGLHNGFGPNFSVLGDHFSPILAVLAPLYWIYGGPQTLLVAQPVLFALAIPPIWVFARRAFGGGAKATAAAYLACVAYGLSWPLASAAAFDFHEVAFAPVLTALALERLQAGRLRSALLALAALLLVKEDMGLLVAGIGCFLIVSRQRTVPRQWLVGLGCIVAGLTYTAVAVYVLIPAFGGRASYYWAYSDLGANVPQAAWHVMSHPLGTLRLMVTPDIKFQTLLWLVGAFCFLPLLSPVTLAALPLLAERMLNSQFPNWWGTGFQYNAFIVVVLVCAAVDGAARLDRWAVRAWRSAGGLVPLAGTAAMVAVAVLSVPVFALGSALHHGFYQRTPRMLAAAAAVAAVPPGVTVAAVNNLGPQLSARDTVLLWDGDGTTPVLGAPWVIADTAHSVFTFHNLTEQRERVRFLERHDYVVVFQRAGYLVLQRAGSGTHA